MRIYPNLTVDGEFKTLGDLGYTGALNDRQFTFLRAQGYQNSLADMMNSWKSYSPIDIFSAAEQGVWYDPSDLTTLFQDSAGTTPVTAPGQPVGRMLDKSGRGNHATQSTGASRPIYGIHPLGGRRNLLTWSEDFTNATWQKGGTSSISAATVGQIFRCGTTPASQMTSASLAYSSNSVFTMSLKAKPAGSNFVIFSLVDLTTGAFQRFWYNVSTGVVGASASGGTTVVSPATSISGPDADGFYRCSLSATLTSAANTRFALNISKTNNAFDGDATSGANINQSQLELGSLSNYQRVTTQYDVTEAGVPSVSYLFFDGVNDSLATPTITPGIDKVQVFAGVRKLSDAASGVIVESSTSAGTSNGAFGLLGRNSSGYSWVSRGTILVNPLSTGSASPRTDVLTGVGDISGDLATFRVNGTQASTSSGDQGTGNYLAYPLFIGARAGTSLFFSGHLYSLIARFGPNLNAGQISAAENWVANKTGVVL